MASLTKVLREEIGRITRSQTEQVTAQLRRTNAQLKKQVTDLRRRVRVLELRAARRDVTPAGQVPISEADLKEMKRQRPTSTLIKQLRKRLEVSQRELALLLGVSTQAVYLWERQNGRLNLRDRAKTALLEVRKMSKEDARQHLDTPAAG